MSKREKRDIWYAIGKLSGWKKFMLLLIVIAMGTSIVMGIFFVGTRDDITTLHVPDSVLANSDVIQKREQGVFSDLTIPVMFPDSNYGVYVGRAESLYSQYCASFVYSENTTIIIGKYSDAYASQDFYSHAIPSVMTTADTSGWAYNAKVIDQGYLNKEFLTYDSGILSGNGKDYFLLTYRKQDDGNELVIAVAIQTDSQWRLNSARKLLGRIAETMFYQEVYAPSSTSSTGVSLTPAVETTSPVSDDASGIGSGTGTVVGENGMGNSGSAVGDYNATSDEGLNTDVKQGEEASKDASMSDSEYYAQVDRELAEKRYALQYPDAQDTEVSLPISAYNTDEKVYFYIRYTEVDSIPAEATLTAPDGTVYSVPANNNDAHNGLVYFVVDKPMMGEWTLHLSANTRYGKYYYDTLSEDAFQTMFGENNNPTPRGGE